jgi:solute carrier family 25 (mitochondrial phosphate transporter), member 23/24/25/41
LNSEGDTSISEETLEGLGRPRSFISILFGAIIKIAEPPQKSSRSFPAETSPSQEITPPETMYEHDQAHFVETTIEPAVDEEELLAQNEESCFEDVTTIEQSLLTVLPDPGYFFAGAVAGAVSRTATAPLDRIKVYLIANVGPTKDTIEAAKQGNAVAAAKKFGQPLVAATKELWKAGGMRSLFAGKCYANLGYLAASDLTLIGNGLNVLKVMPESAIKFGSYEAAKRALAQLEGHGDPQNINPYSKFVAGGAGGLVSQYAFTPFWP